MQVLITLKERVAAHARTSPLGQRWQQLATRERQALTLLGVFVLLAVLYSLLWQPASRELSSARSYYQQQRELNTYLLQNAAQARQRASAVTVQLLPEQLRGLVTQSAQQYGLRLERFDSDGEGLRVSLGKASFEALLGFFTELQARGVLLSEVSLDRADDGLVAARLTLTTIAR